MKLNSNNNISPNLGGKRPRFNIYWVWALIAVLLVGWSLMGSSDVAQKTNWDNVKVMIEKGDVQKIDIINKESAEVFLKRTKVCPSRDRSSCSTSVRWTISRAISKAR
mgnify:CR=1 FL=1